MAIAAQFQKLLESCQEMEFSHLRPLVDRMFENADVALLDFAEKAENNVAQSLFFEAMNEVRKKRKFIEQHFYAEVKRSFSEFPVRPETQTEEETPQAEPGSLSLVGTEEVETYVATQNASGKLASRIMDRIFALKQRLTVLNSGTAIEENQIPGGPAWLGAAFQHAVQQLELENKVRLVFIALFDKYVLSHAETLFDEYNKRLIQADILPNLRYEVRKQAGGVEIIEKHLTGAQAEDEDPEALPGEDLDQQSPSELGDELFGRICELMSGHRSRTNTGGGAVAGGGAGSGGGVQPGNVSPINPGGTGQPASMATGDIGQTLVRQISSLQSNVLSSQAGVSSAEFIENIEIDEHLIERLQSTLSEEREKIFGAVDRRQLPAADTNVIELVGMMFEYMLKEEHLPNVVKALLSRLHTPLLKVAVVDRNFFIHSGHPARKLLNDMTAAGIRWVEESEIDRGIFPKMQQIVDTVLSDFKENVELFDELLEDFTEAVGELDKRAKLVEKRTNEAANGQEKLQAARERARREVDTACGGRPVAEAVRDFLQRILADKLTFTLLRNEQGDQSDDWRQAITLAERIVDFSLPPVDGDEREAREEALEAFQADVRSACETLHQPDKEKLLGELFEHQRNVLEHIAPVPEPVAAAAPEPQPEPQPAPHPESQEPDDALSDEQRAMLEKLNGIPFGTWFEFAKPGQPVKRAKLSWRSTVTEKFMFVDQMGVKAAVVCMHELAERMIEGTVRIATTDKRPFVDRALSAIHRMLDRAA